MHDCRETKERLLDLAFDEVDASQRLHLLREIESCLGCRKLYQSTMSTLLAFDQAAEAAMPDERFWAGYHGRLRAGIAQKVLSAAEPVQSVRARLPHGVSSWWLPFAAGVALLLLALGAWAAMRERRGAWPGDRPVAHDDRLAPDSSTEIAPGGLLDRRMTPGSSPAKVRAPKRHAGRRPGVGPNSRRLLSPTPDRDDFAEALTVVGFETARHIERAGMVLRSFRNTSVASETATVDVEYEKLRSKELLDTNVLLRRSAETTHNVVVSEVLGHVEPFLIDIVNLPDRPSPQDVRSISDRMDRAEILIELQLYSAEASNRATPPGKY